jgi:hypothetical protein
MAPPLRTPRGLAALGTSRPRRSLLPSGAVPLSRAELARLANRILRPDQDDADCARAAVEDLADPAEAWAALARGGVIPATWLDEPTRSFASYPPGLDDGRIVSARHPATIADAVRFASDAAGMQRAEALARTACAALAPWGGAAPSVIRWLVHDLRDARLDRGRALWRAEWAATSALDAFPDALDGAAERSEELRAQLARIDRHLAFTAARDLFAAEAWALAVTRDLEVPPTSASPQLRPGARFAALPDPFGPLAAIWTTGYALVGIAPAAITLLTVDERAQTTLYDNGPE